MARPTKLIESVERCPFCQFPPEEHEMRPGHLHWVWTCPSAPPGWVGVFVDRPVEPHVVAQVARRAPTGAVM